MKLSVHVWPARLPLAPEAYDDPDYPNCFSRSRHDPDHIMVHYIDSDWNKITKEEFDVLNSYGGPHQPYVGDIWIAQRDKWLKSLEDEKVKKHNAHIESEKAQKEGDEKREKRLNNILNEMVYGSLKYLIDNKIEVDIITVSGENYNGHIVQDTSLFIYLKSDDCSSLSLIYHNRIESITINLDIKESE